MWMVHDSARPAITSVHTGGGAVGRCYLWPSVLWKIVGHLPYVLSLLLLRPLHNMGMLWNSVLGEAYLVHVQESAQRFQHPHAISHSLRGRAVCCERAGARGVLQGILWRRHGSCLL